VSQRDSSASFGMRYRIAPAASPDVRSGATGRLQAYAFAPVETPDGTFHMAVSHQPASAVKILEKTTLPPALPHIITDYMGGDSLTAGGAVNAAGTGGGGSGGVRGPLTRRSTLSASLYSGGSGFANGGCQPSGGTPAAPAAAVSPSEPATRELALPTLTSVSELGSESIDAAYISQPTASDL